MNGDPGAMGSPSQAASTRFLMNVRHLPAPGATSSGSRYEAAMALQLLSAPSRATAAWDKSRGTKGKTFVLKVGIGGNAGIHSMSPSLWEGESDGTASPPPSPPRRGAKAGRSGRAALLAGGEAVATLRTLGARPVSATSKNVARAPQLKTFRDRDAPARPHVRKRPRSHTARESLSAGLIDNAPLIALGRRGPVFSPQTCCSRQSTTQSSIYTDDSLYRTPPRSQGSPVLFPPALAAHHCSYPPAYASVEPAHAGQPATVLQTSNPPLATASQPRCQTAVLQTSTSENPHAFAASKSWPPQACRTPVLQASDSAHSFDEAQSAICMHQPPNVMYAQPFLPAHPHWSDQRISSPHCASAFAAMTASHTSAHPSAHPAAHPAAYPSAQCAPRYHAGGGAAFAAASAAAAAAASAEAAQIESTTNLLEARAAWQVLLNSFPPNPERIDWLPELDLLQWVTAKGILPSTAHILRQSYAVCCSERGGYHGKASCRDFLHTLRVTGLSFIASVDEWVTRERADAQWQEDERRRRRRLVLQQPPPEQGAQYAYAHAPPSGTSWGE